MAEIDVSNANLLDAERTVLGSIIIDPELLPKVMEKITPEHFHSKIHSGIFAVMQMLFVGGNSDINIAVLTESCIKQSVFDSRDEAREYLYKLTDTSVEKSSIESYAKILDEKYLLRQLILASGEIYDKAAAGVEEASAILDYAETRIYSIRNSKEIGGLLHIGPTIREALKDLAYLAEHPDEAGIKGLRTGFPLLDSYIHGLNPANLIVIAARPGMGKTSFAMNIAVNAARINRGKSIAVFNLEMSRRELVERMLSSEGKITSDQMQDGKIERSQWRGLVEAADMLNSVQIFIDDTARISSGEMKAKLRRMQNLGLVIVDHIQLMSSGRNELNRVAEISEITRNLKILAKELEIPVIALSQLSRSAEARTDKRPILSDLRDSGSIEQDADIVLFLYREAYHDQESENLTSAECIVAKNRHGTSNTSVHLRWDGQFTRFTEVDKRYDEQ